MSKCRKTPVQQLASPVSFSPDVLADIFELFAKNFSYGKPLNNEWQLPDPSEIFTCDHTEFNAFLDLKNSLNEVKNLLSDKKLDEWHEHTAFTNKAGKIISHVRKSVNAELCTQAWCKFHEILCSFPLIPQEAFQNGKLNSLHLCEAPGAFIASLNHYLKSHRFPCDWSWVANTLNPYHEANDDLMMIMDDRLIANTLHWWYFGPDNTGDIMTLKFLTGLQNFISSMATVHLVTADGSFDCQGNPGEQEALVSSLHYCEVVTALTTLGNGGSFVLKMFTMFEHCSINLMYLLNCCFDQVHVFKPATSKAGNSEVYVICLHYKGKEAIYPLLSKMILNFGTEMKRKALFPHHVIPDSFLKRHEECCVFFHKYQLETISENIRLFECMGKAEQEKLNNLRDCAVQYFMQKFQLKHLSRNNWLVKKSGIGCSTNTKWFGQRNKYFKTYNERKMLEALSWKDKVAKGYFNSWAEEHGVYHPGQSSILEGAASNLECHLWHILEGKKLPKVKCSPFCNGEILKTLNEAIEKSLGGAFNLDSKFRPKQQYSCSCHVFSEELIFSELCSLTECLQDEQVVEPSNQIKCLLVGFSTSHNIKMHIPLEIRLLESAELTTFSCSLLHDGDPTYQHLFLDCLLHSLRELHTGDVMILPVLSCFTRFMAGLIFVLHSCFRFITFFCPTSSDPLRTCAVLLCVGYQDLPNPVFQYLQSVNELLSTLLNSDSPQQVLQFVPMEVLLKGALLDFLWDLNAAIAKRHLHFIIQREREEIINSLQLQN
ncbi:cap-specific mRNA (nucleoside-2'-O-)-methyltransferase 2 [Trachypithecus francoisi]|uniref:cap-specific mRNA (nucleoside-2'-O-)-methyltransferase 2 n=1 Tax=Trachypithecus francoisi TaxID=54180 RepID=UPI00141BDF4A|nr:cap-specific mRNA (nucleoside-2'-O-)-methyltransferase 2 [Trachypithecus francoisi]XP_033074832.1 cap-specific mRNA (nucleoside-2'-O-)-methyltransferase 2 [Trachypithecus francoisi]XP_033074833.1 cap-specific mRNA (nucleoside-2'-O-)-methyltransferase 2 [Trachypithecus francoisi]XP_033074834.1 cap-specific mRNA (nucleoside-2'-O-)-methyltransferase 2 [Trachypithecus francoisi]XP_033074835.1 cap-specific mRNA (nucleoside-2'-O-)-methyltransferase 2 [Trachypithecus francoisi]XP_033074836.1 cap-s